MQQNALVKLLTPGAPLPVGWLDSLFLLAGLLSVRYAPVSEGTKACKEAKAKQENQTKQSKNQNTNKKTHHSQTTPQPHEAFAASETSETAFTRNR